MLKSKTFLGLLVHQTSKHHWNFIRLHLWGNRVQSTFSPSSSPKSLDNFLKNSPPFQHGIEDWLNKEKQTKTNDCCFSDADGNGFTPLCTGFYFHLCYFVVLLLHISKYAYKMPKMIEQRKRMTVPALPHEATVPWQCGWPISVDHYWYDVSVVLRNCLSWKVSTAVGSLWETSFNRLKATCNGIPDC